MNALPRRLVAAPLSLALGAALLVALSSPARPSAAPANDPDAREWIQLFNGKDLTGWTPKFAKHDLGENFDTFRVENGLLESATTSGRSSTASSATSSTRTRSLLPPRRRVPLRRRPGEGRPGVGPRNNGLMLHSPAPETMLKDQDFPISIEVQLLGGLGDGKPRTTANLCTPGTNVVMGGKLHRALHELDVEDLRRRPVGAGRSAGEGHELVQH